MTYDYGRAIDDHNDTIDRIEAADKAPEFEHTIDLDVTLGLKGETGTEAVKVIVAYDNPRAAIAALHRVGSDEYLLQVAEMIDGLPEGIELVHDEDDD